MARKQGKNAALRRDAQALRIDAEAAGTLPAKAVGRSLEQTRESRRSPETDDKRMRHDLRLPLVRLIRGADYFLKDDPSAARRPSSNPLSPRPCHRRPPR